MGYAKLNYSTTANTAQMLYEVVQIVTGNITSNSSLIYANTNVSIIVDELGSGNNWTTVYGIPRTNANTFSYVLESPCVDSSKFHRVRLFSTNGSAVNQGNLFSNAFAGISMSTITSATSATAVSNETYYSTTGTAGGLGRHVITINSVSSSIHLSWSKHHIVLYGATGNTTTAVTGVIGSFEYPETSVSQFTKSAPTAHLKFQSNSFSSFAASTAPGVGTFANIVFQGTQIYEPLTQQTSGVYNLGVDGVGTCQPFKIDPQPGVDTTGNTAYMLAPFYWTVPSKGLPVFNLSTYSKFYQTYSAAGQPETLITAGPDTYVYLTVGSNIASPTGNCGIVMLRA